MQISISERLSATPFAWEPYSRTPETSRLINSKSFFSEAMKVSVPIRRRRMNIGFDEIEILEAAIDDLAIENIELYLEKREKARDIPRAQPDTEFLKKIKAVRQQNGTVHPTVAGILLFSNQPENHIPGAVIKCARFKCIEMDEFIDQRIITGSLFTQCRRNHCFL